jgi:hypothetical protein
MLLILHVWHRGPITKVPKNRAIFLLDLSKWQPTGYHTQLFTISAF